MFHCWGPDADPQVYIMRLLDQNPAPDPDPSLFNTFIRFRLISAVIFVFSIKEIMFLQVSCQGKISGKILISGILKGTVA